MGCSCGHKRETCWRNLGLRKTEMQKVKWKKASQLTFSLGQSVGSSS